MIATPTPRCILLVHLEETSKSRSIVVAKRCPKRQVVLPRSVTPCPKVVWRGIYVSDSCLLARQEMMHTRLVAGKPGLEANMCTGWTASSTANCRLQGPRRMSRGYNWICWLSWLSSGRENGQDTRYLNGGWAKWQTSDSSRKKAAWDLVALEGSERGIRQHEGKEGQELVRVDARQAFAGDAGSK